MNFIWIAILAGLILIYIVPLAAYPMHPGQVVSHGNAAGEPDGSIARFTLRQET